MGSLMAGWDSPVLDPDTVNSMRNRSFTKEEIADFWRLHKTSEEEEEHPFAAVSLEKDNQESKTAEGAHQSSHSPVMETFKGFSETGSDVDLDKAKKTDDWWTRSSWAFLNEPPLEEIDDRSHKYVAQFHVAELANKKAMPAH